MAELGVTRNEIVNKLNLSLHGDLPAYQGVIGAACKQDPEFVAHLISFDFTNGQIKDSKIALPVITLASRDFPDELIENSLAHIAMQPPREMLKAVRFAIASNTTARRQKSLDRVVRGYLAQRESEPGKWSRLAVRHRRSLKSLYALTHAPMPQWASIALFGSGSITSVVFRSFLDIFGYLCSSGLAYGRLTTWDCWKPSVFSSECISKDCGSIGESLC